VLKQEIDLRRRSSPVSARRRSRADHRPRTPVTPYAWFRKTGLEVAASCRQCVDRVPPPPDRLSEPLSALISTPITTLLRGAEGGVIVYSG